MTFSSLAPVIAVALALATSPLHVSAQPAAAPGQDRPAITVPLQDLPDHSITERAGQYWDNFLGLFRMGPNSTSVMRQRAQAARGQGSTSLDFSALMDIAGYKLKEIESTVGIVPYFSMTFGQSRDLTEADREFLERTLERHSRNNSTPLAWVQRAIVHAVLEASDLGGLAIDKVEIEFLPLPRVKFVLAPADAPLGLDAARIMRAVEQLNRRLQQGPSNRPAFQIPQPMPGSSNQRAAMLSIN